VQHRLTLVSMSGLRVGDPSLLAKGMRMPGLFRRASALSQLPPLGLLTIAAMVPEPWEVQLLQDDGQVAPYELADQIIETAPSLVAFSSLTPSADRAAKISSLLREKNVVTIIGGLHATADPTHCSRHFDVVVQGDGEPSIIKLLNDWSDNRLKPHYVAHSPFDLSHSPLPRWELLGEHRPPRYTLQTMRGCPWNCSFCAASRLLGPPRIKPDAIIEKELQSIASQQARPWIELADDNTFAGDRDHTPMLEMLAQHGARWFTESDWRIALRPDLLRQIARSGCRQILIGLESNVFRYPGMGGKTADWQRMVDAVHAIQEAGIVVNACFIVGADGETPASIERLGDFLETAPFGEIQITLQTPFPGTSLHRSLSDSGRLLPGDYSRYTLFDVTYQPNLMTAQQLQSCFHALIERVFADHNQQRRNAIQKTVRKKRRI
jgi:radical SAM superfamily enzyme YgiQ (UPF0313 family)